jgi:hypothetical protein
VIECVPAGNVNAGFVAVDGLPLLAVGAVHRYVKGLVAQFVTVAVGCNVSLLQMVVGDCIVTNGLRLIVITVSLKNTPQTAVCVSRT